MTIGIDGREICEKPAGKGQYLLRILIQWQEKKDLKLIIYTLEGQKLPLLLSSPSVIHKQVSGKGPFWHWNVAKCLHGDGVIVFFAALSYQSAIWNRIPTVTVVHDLAVFRLPTLAHNKRAFWVERLTLKLTVQKSARIVAVSQATKADLEEIIHASPNKIAVIYEAPLLGNHGLPLERTKRGSFLLFTGTLEPRKNIGTILRAFALLPQALREMYRLKFAGKPGWGGIDYRAIAETLGIEQHVDFLGYVSDEELKDLFQTASVMVYPSLYEGFGLPVIEAMAVGTPVVTSTVSSLPEVVGLEGITCDPHNAKEISGRIESLLTDTALWEAQSNYLYKRSMQFHWNDIAQSVQTELEHYERD